MASEFKICVLLLISCFPFFLSPKRGRTALSIAMQGSHADTAALLQAHAKARAL